MGKNAEKSHKRIFIKVVILVFMFFRFSALIFVLFYLFFRNTRQTMCRYKRGFGFLCRKLKNASMTTMVYFLSVYFILSVLANLRQLSQQYNTDKEEVLSSGGVIRRSVATEMKVVRTSPKTLLDFIDVDKIPLNRTVFGSNYTLNRERSSEFDFPYIIDGKNICKKHKPPYLVIMVPSVHTHIDTRSTIRQTWGRSADPGVWPKVGVLKKVVKLVFLFGTSKTALGNNIVKEESKMHGDIVQADFVDSYFNLTYKSVMGLRWVAEFCSESKYVLKADEDVFVHVKNLLDFLEKQDYKPRGTVFGHALLKSEVLRTGRWAVTKQAFPLSVYPTYTCGNTYVISTNMAANIYYTAGLLPYLNIEDVFVTGIVREFLGADLGDVLGFTHWFERKPIPCEFKNTIRISATKVADYLQTAIWEGLKQNLTDCYNPVRTSGVKARRPDNTGVYTLVRDDHIFKNKTSGKFYVL